MTQKETFVDLKKETPAILIYDQIMSWFPIPKNKRSTLIESHNTILCDDLFYDKLKIVLNNIIETKFPEYCDEKDEKIKATLCSLKHRLTSPLPLKHDHPYIFGCTFNQKCFCIKDLECNIETNACQLDKSHHNIDIVIYFPRHNKASFNFS